MNKNNTISKEYLLAEIDDLADEFSELDENGLHSERWCGIMDSRWVIVNTPSVSDRPQGGWIIHSNGKMCDCSACNESYDRTFEYVDEWNFCPNCGARMLIKDYKNAVEQMEHDAIWEPTYNADDGSM